MNAKLGSTETLEITFFLLISSDLCHKKMLLQSLNIPLIPILALNKLKGVVIDSNNIFLWHESEDINKKSLFPKFQLIPSSIFQVMHDYVCFIAPIDYCVE